MNNVIQIDTGTICNLDCIFCYRKNCEKNKNTVTKFEDIKAVFSRKSLFSSIVLFGNGEFFANPEWKKIFTYCIEETFLSQDNFPKKVFLNTNSTLLDNQTVEFIFETLKKSPVFIRFTFSLNAFNDSTYQKITGKDLCNNVYKQTGDFIEKALDFNEKNGEKISLNVQSIVISENENELEGFIEYWKVFFEKKGITPMLVEENYPEAQFYTVSLRQYVEDKKTDREYFEKVVNKLKQKFDIKFIPRKIQSYFKRKACNEIFNLTLFDNNKRKLCCKDFPGKYSYPAEGVMHDIYNYYYKTLHLLGDFEKIQICTVCNDYEPVCDEEILKSDFDKKLINMYFQRVQTGVPFDFYKTDNTDLIKNFLKNHDYTSYDKIYSDRVSLNKQKEDFFCTAWKTYIKSDNGTIYSGCDKQTIQIEDWEKFSQEIFNNPENVLPQKCIMCEQKFSHNSRQDRMRVFGDNSFYSYNVINNEFQNKIKKFAQFVENKSLKEAENLISENFNYDFLSLFLDNYKFLADNDFVFELIFKTSSIFLKLKYLKVCDKKFEKACEKIQNLRFYSDINLLFKIIDYKLETYIYKSFEALFDENNYTGYNYNLWRKKAGKALFGYLTLSNFDFFIKIFNQYIKISSKKYDRYFKTVFYVFFKEKSDPVNEFQNFFKLSYNVFINTFLHKTLIENTVYYLNNSEFLLNFNTLEDLIINYEYVKFYEKYKELQNTIEIVEKHMLLRVKNDFNNNIELLTDLLDFFKKQNLIPENREIFTDVIKYKFEKTLEEIDIEKIDAETFIEKIHILLKFNNIEVLFNNYIKKKLIDNDIDNQKLSAKEIFQSYQKFKVLSKSHENREIFKSVFLNRIINFIEQKNDISDLIKKLQDEEIFYNEKILGALDFKLAGFLQNKKFYSYLKIIKKNSEFLKMNSWIFDNISDYDFEKIDYRFIKLLYVLSFENSDYTDKFNYTMYSFYMKIKNYPQALFFLENIKNKLSFFTLSKYIKTRYFLLKNI